MSLKSYPSVLHRTLVFLMLVIAVVVLPISAKAISNVIEPTDPSLPPNNSPNQLESNIQTELEQLVEEVNELEQLYNTAYIDFQNGRFSSSEARIREAIARLVDPDFPQLSAENSNSESACGDLPRLLRRVCRATEDAAIWAAENVAIPMARRTEQLFFGESDIEWDWEDEEVRLQLEESAEQAHRTATNSLRLLQRVLIAQNNTEENIAEVLEIAELGRELEYIRIAPLLTVGELLEETSIPSGMEVSQMKRISRQQEAVIVYYSVVASNELYIWVIQPDGNIYFKAVRREPEAIPITELAEVTRQATASYVERGEDEVAYAAWTRDLRSNRTDILEQDLPISEAEQSDRLQSLHQILIEPIEDFLPKSDVDTHIVFVPQNSLLSVPFAALKNSSDQYFIDEHTVRITPSLRNLLHSSDKIDDFLREEEFLIVGNPTMPTIQLTEEDATVKLPELRGAETEALSLAKVFETPPLIGSEASEINVLQRIENAKVIHLATHGILDNQNLELTSIDLGKVIEEEYGARTAGYFSELADSLLPGAIALAPSDEEDGLLTAREILNLELDAELVVLSACNTARGISSQSTVLGLPFSLGAAGASRVVVSLWAVPDTPTQQLMVEYYLAMRREALAGEDVDPAGALRQAMLAIKEKEAFRDPVNWAAFTLIDVQSDN